MPQLNRRQFLTGAAAVTLAPSARSAEPQDETVAYFLVGDTHYLAKNDAQLDDRSALVTRRLIETLNRLPGTEIPKQLGGAMVLPPRGVIHAGDCIDSGDKPRVNMQAVEWAAFADGFGLTGQDGQLKMPVYEVHGNHDSPRGDGLAIEKIIARNRTRPGVSHVAKNGVHYSWDWGRVHFINLGITVGQTVAVARRRRYAPLDSLDFLVSDLKEKVGTSGRPVVITHHIDMIRYAQPLPVDDAKAMSMEWDPADVKGFHNALAGCNIMAIQYGHTHARNVFRWDGSARQAKEGIPVFNVDNGSHFASKQQAFFYVEIRGTTLRAREYATVDGWATSGWTPLTWSTANR